MSDCRLRVLRLCCVPIRFGAIQLYRQRRMELVVLRPLLEVIAPVFITKADQPGFFGNTTFNALTISCTQAFSLIGSSAIISEPAATRIAMAASVVGSITTEEDVPPA